MKEALRCTSCRSFSGLVGYEFASLIVPRTVNSTVSSSTPESVAIKQLTYRLYFRYSLNIWQESSFAGQISACCLMVKTNSGYTCIATIFHFDWITLYIAYGSDVNVKPICI